MRQDFAGIGAIGHLLAILIVGALGVVLGLVIDTGNSMFTGLSADASNTIYFLEVAFGVSFILFLLAVIFSHWINEKSDANQGV